MKDETQARFVSVLLILILGAGAFWDGLYSPAQQLLAAGAMAAAVLAAGGGGRLARLDVLSLGLLAAGVGLSLVRPAAAGTAAHGPPVAAGWGLALLLGCRLAGSELLPRLLGRIWSVTGFLMAFGGLAAISYLPENHSGRLAGFLGYPIAVGMLGLLGLAGALPALSAGRRWAPALAFGNALAFWLSGSRGVWAAGLLLAAYLAWAAPGLLRRGWAPAAAALAAALWAGPAVAAEQRAAALLPALLGLAAATAWGLRRHRLADAAVAAACVAGAAAAPGWDWFLGRAAALPLTEGSSVERLTFLRDGLAMALEHPLGAGYRAWTALHLQGASYGYYSAEAHSVLVDLALAFGWVGGAAFLLLLGRFLWGLRQGRQWGHERLAALAGLGALGLHSLVDWDLSYGLFAIPLWVGFGLLSAHELGHNPPGAAVKALAALTLAAGVLLGASDMFSYSSQRAREGGAPRTAFPYASLATTLTPWDDAAHAALGMAQSALGQPEAAAASLAAARRLNPREPWYAELHARELTAAGRWREAADAWREYVRLWPWEVRVYEVALEALMDSGLQAGLQGDPERGAYVAAAARDVLDTLDRQKAQEPAGRPRRPMQIDTSVIRRARIYFPAPGTASHA